jgi:hypothetical protein
MKANARLVSGVVNPSACDRFSLRFSRLEAFNRKEREGDREERKEKRLGALAQFSKSSLPVVLRASKSRCAWVASFKG